MILTGGLGFGGGLVARGYGAWIGGMVEGGDTEEPGGSVGGRIRNARIRRIERDDEEIMEILNMLFAGGAIQ